MFTAGAYTVGSEGGLFMFNTDIVEITNHAAGSLFCESYHELQNSNGLGLITGGRYDRGSVAGIYIADHTTGTSTVTNLQGSTALSLVLGR